jgi:hypothetical protein
MLAIQNMAKCNSCGKGVNSTYVRQGIKGLMHKIGYYCSDCDIYLDPTTKKLYTVNKETLYSYPRASPEEPPVIEKMSIEKEPWLGFGPRTFALPRQRSTRLSYQGTNTPIRNEAMELHLKHIESSLTARQVSKSLLAN